MSSANQKTDLKKVAESPEAKATQASAKQALKKELKRSSYEQGQARLNPQPEGPGDKKDPISTPEKPVSPIEDPAVQPDAKTSHSYGLLDPKFEKVEGTPYIKEEDDANEIDMDDVSQGQLGDCYLVASLGAIADKNPDAIRKMIKDNKNGTFTITFAEGGAVVVDDQFPIKDGKTVYADAGDSGKEGKELWVMLIEKAWAKLKGGYEKIQGGQVRMNSTDAMEALTGNKTSTVYTASEKNEAMLAALAKGQDQGLPMTASSWDDKHYDEATLKKMGEKGVHANHAYTVVSVDVKAGTVTLFNPWGKETTKPVLDMDEFRKYYQYIHLNSK